MKKLTIILLIAVYTFGATGASQLFKLPVLIQHYLEHKQENPAISLLAFFKIHYTDPFVKDDDFHRDMQLPFKTLENLNFLALTILPLKVAIENKTLPLLPSNHVLRNVRVNKAFNPYDFFQPPRQLV